MVETNNDIIDVTANENSSSRKICTVKFLFNNVIAYRFDLYTHPEKVDGSKVVELKNAYNNFHGVVPEKTKLIGDFFKLVGVIKYVFPTVYIPIGDDVNEDSMVITIENNINQYIKMGKIKGMEIKVDRD